MKGAKQIFASARTADSRAAGSTDDWGTPQAFFDLLDGEFHFTLDPCANADNAKSAYFSIEEGVDGLEQDWGKNVCFVNFPYSQAKAWATKCVEAARKGATVVVLCAARTDTGWWQHLIDSAAECRFVKGRLAFVGPKGTGQSATFPSCVVVLQPGLSQSRPDGAWSGQCELRLWDVPAEVRR